MNPLEIRANIKNWRKHPKFQRDALEGVLREVGWVQDVIVNQQTQRLVDGHLRVALAIEKGEKQIPVKLVDLTEAEEALVLATIDPITSMAETDAGALDALLREVKTGEAALQSLLSDLYETEIKSLDNLASNGADDDDSLDLDDDDDSPVDDQRVKVQIGALSCSISPEKMDVLVSYIQKLGRGIPELVSTELSTLLEGWIGELR